MPGKFYGAFRATSAVAYLVFLIVGCSDASLTGKGGVRPTPKPSIGANGATSGGGDGQSPGNLESEEAARKQVQSIKLSGSWTFDGCGDVTFDLRAGTIAVARRGNPNYFLTQLNFDLVHGDGSTSKVNLDARSSGTAQARIPNWNQACLKNIVQPPTLSPVERVSPAAQPVIVTGNNVDSNNVVFKFDDDGGDPTSCPSKGKSLGGAVTVDANSFQFELKPCP